jgi:hypothetical protein
LAWDCYDTHGRCLEAALRLSHGGRGLESLGLGDDIETAARIDAFALVPELFADPPRIKVGAAGIVKSYWTRS